MVMGTTGAGWIVIFPWNPATTCIMITILGCGGFLSMSTRCSSRRCAVSSWTPEGDAPAPGTGIGGQPPPPLNAPLPNSLTFGIQPGPASPFIRAIQVVIQGGPNSALLVYSPSPGPGNLVYSISGTTFTDPVSGQVVTPTATAYGTLGTYAAKIVEGIQAGSVGLRFFTGAPSESNAASIQSTVSFSGAANEAPVVQITGPSGTGGTDRVTIFLNAPAADDSFSAGGTLNYSVSPGNSQALLAWGFSGLSRSSKAGMTGGVPLNQMDTTTRTVTAITATQISGNPAIPANDPVVGGGQNTTYHFRVSGNGTEANPAVTGTIAFSIFGVNVFSQTLTPAGAAAAFNWVIDIWATVVTTGVSGTCDVGGWFLFTSAGGTVQSAINSTAVAVNTTVATHALITWAWTSATGAPTISGNLTAFAREGS